MSGGTSLILLEENGIQFMPCSSCIVSGFRSVAIGNTLYAVIDCCAKYFGRMTSLWYQYELSCYGNSSVTSMVSKHGHDIQSMPYSANFSMAFRPEILSTETSDFLKQKIIFKSFYYVF